MLISLILAWVAVFAALMTVLKVVARLSGNKKLNRFFFKCHIPFGIILIVAGGIHAVLAGNASNATLSTFRFAPVLFTSNWGTFCMVAAILLAVTFLLRKRLKRRWMFFHRILTVVFIGCLVLHVSGVGIQIGDRLFGEDTTVSASSSLSESSSSVSTYNADSSADTAGDSTQSSSTDDVVTFSGAVLKDGTYEGSADGYQSTITVSVVVSGGKVTELSVVDEGDTPSFFSKAEALLDEITQQQSLEVDAVTGATYSSAGIINAVSDALQNAVVSGTLQVNQIDLSSIKHGR